MLDTKVVDPDLSDTDARDAGELVERLDDDGSQTHLIAIAPHGGDIEEHTDEQAERVAERLGPQLASAWRGKGWRPDGGAFVRWHITSTDLNPVCFPLLNSVMSRRFAHAVAFHGFDDEPGVLIGGTAPADVKERLRQAIQQVLPAGLDVRVALPDERYGGDDPNNIVNRLSPCGGIQIEQGTSPRDDHGCDIADVVADFFRPAPAPRESWARRGIEAPAGASVGGGAVTRRPPPQAPPWLMRLLARRLAVRLPSGCSGPSSFRLWRHAALHRLRRRGARLATRRRASRRLDVPDRGSSSRSRAAIASDVWSGRGSAKIRVTPKRTAASNATSSPAWTARRPAPPSAAEAPSMRSIIRVSNSLRMTTYSPSLFSKW